MTLKQRLITLALALPVSFSASSLFAGEFYKWVDENGTTHYGERPPKGVDSNKVKTHTGRSEPTRYETKRKVAEQATQSEDQKAQRNADACKSARKNLETINSNARIKVRQDNGEFRYLSPDEINERKRQAQEVIQQNC